MKAPLFRRHRTVSAPVLTCPSNPELGPAKRRLVCEAERAAVRELLAVTPVGSPLHDYREALLDDAPVPSHADYVAGLESELARLRGLIGGQR